MNNHFLNLIKLDGLPGREKSIRDYILNNISYDLNDVYVDKKGNIIAKRLCKNPVCKVLIAAHMDEVGFMVMDILEDGSLRIEPLGFISPTLVAGSMLAIGENRIPGIIYAKEAKIQSFASLRVDIGAKDKNEALANVKPGDGAVFDMPSFEFGKGYICSKAIDDRCGCAALLELANDKGSFPFDLFFTFTSMEEVFIRGAEIASKLSPDIAVILEGTYSDYLPYIDESLWSTLPGKGAIINIIDSRVIYDSDLKNIAVKVAQDKNIDWQYKNVAGAANDSIAFQCSGEGAKVAAFSISVRNIHSGAGVSNMNDLSSMISLTREFIMALSKDQESD